MEVMALEVGTRLDGAKVGITYHAMDQLWVRIGPFDEYDDIPARFDEQGWKEKLELIVSELYEEDLDSKHRLQRIINNEFVQARYFYSRRYGLRFVVRDTRDGLDGSDMLQVLTVERPYPYSRHGVPKKKH